MHYLYDTLAKEIIRNIYNDSKRIDIFVNKAGYGLLGALEDQSTNKIKDKFETKFYRTIRVTQTVYLLCEIKSAKIFNINSVEGKLGIPFMSADVNTKFAIEGLTESLLYEVESFRIKWIKRARRN